MAHNQLPVNRTEYDSSTGCFIEEKKSGEVTIEVEKAGRRPSLTLDDKQARHIYEFLKQRFS